MKILMVLLAGGRQHEVRVVKRDGRRWGEFPQSNLEKRWND
jgi:hypothetical protein